MPGRCAPAHISAAAEPCMTGVRKESVSHYNGPSEAPSAEVFPHHNACKLHQLSLREQAGGG